MTILAVANSISDFLDGSNFSGLADENVASRRGPFVDEGIRVQGFNLPIPLSFAAPSSTVWFTFYWHSTDSSWSGGSTSWLLSDGQPANANDISKSVLRGRGLGNGFQFEYRSGTTTWTQFATVASGVNRLIRFDIQCVLSNSAGAFRIYENGTLIGQVTGDTILTSEGISELDNLSFFHMANVFPSCYSAIIVADEDCRTMVLEQLSIDGAGSNSGFTGSFSDVNELGLPNDDTKLTSATTGVTSTFSLQNHDSVFDSGYQIEAVVVTARGLGEGGAFLKPVIKSGASTAEGPGTPLELSFLPARGIFHVDPATGAAWTNSAINALEVGVKLDTVP